MNETGTEGEPNSKMRNECVVIYYGSDSHKRGPNLLWGRYVTLLGLGILSCARQANLEKSWTTLYILHSTVLPR